MRSAAVTAYVVAILAIAIIAGCVGQGGKSAEESRGGGVPAIAQGGVFLNESITPTESQLKTKTLACVASASNRRISAIAISSDGNYFASSVGAYDASLRTPTTLYNKTEKLWTYTPPEDANRGNPVKIAISDNAKYTVIGYDSMYKNKVFEVINASGSLIWTLSFNEDLAALISITPNGKYILFKGTEGEYVVYSTDGHIKKWAKTGLPNLRHLDNEYLLWDNSGAFDSEGNPTNYKGRIEKISLETGEVLASAKFITSKGVPFRGPGEISGTDYSTVSEGKIYVPVIDVLSIPNEDSIYVNEYLYNKTEVEVHQEENSPWTTESAYETSALPKELLIRYKLTENGLEKVWEKDIPDDIRQFSGFVPSVNGEHTAFAAINEDYESLLSLIDKEGPTLWTISSSTSPEIRGVMSVSNDGSILTTIMYQETDYSIVQDKPSVISADGKTIGEIADTMYEDMAALSPDGSYAIAVTGDIPCSGGAEGTSLLFFGTPGNEEMVENMKVAGGSDCGTGVLSGSSKTSPELDCFIEASKSCDIASLTLSMTLFTVTDTKYYEIRGLDETGNCKFYLRQVSYSIASPPGANQDVINQMNAQYDTLKGKDGICSYKTADLTKMLEDWRSGTFSFSSSSGSSSPSNCQGSYFDTINSWSK
jgi:hypothetical protein